MTVLPTDKVKNKLDKSGPISISSHSDFEFNT